MSSSNGMEEYYQKVIQLQERLRQSEEERLKLEMKFNEMLQVVKEEEEAHFKKLRSKYKQFLEEDRRRQYRNDKILEALDRIENRTVIWEAKTEKFKAFRKRYHGYLKHPGEQRSRSPFDTERPSEPKQYYYERPSTRGTLFQDKNPKQDPEDVKTDIMEKYLQSLSSQKCKEDILQRKTSEKPLPPESKYSNLGNINSVYWKNPRSTEKTDPEKVDQFEDKLKTTKDLENAFKQNNNASLPAAKDYSYSGLGGRRFMDNNYEDDSSLGKTVLGDDYNNVSSYSKRPSTAFDKLPGNDYTFSTDSQQPQSFRRTSQQLVEKGFTRQSERSPEQVHNELEQLLKQHKDETQNQSFQPVKNETSPINRQAEQFQATPKQQFQPTPTQQFQAPSPPIQQFQPPPAQQFQPVPKQQAPPTPIAVDDRDLATPLPEKQLPRELGETREVLKDDNIASKSPDISSPQVFPKPQPAASDQQQYGYTEDAPQRRPSVMAKQDFNNAQRKMSQNEFAAPKIEKSEVYEPEPQKFDDTSLVQTQSGEQIKPAQQEYNVVDQPLEQNEVTPEPLQQEYDTSGQPLEQYDANGQPLQQYEQDGQYLQQYYDESGQPLQQYDENGQPVQQYDGSGQPLQQYLDENGQPLQNYDENGQPLQQYYDNSGLPQQQFDENGQPLLQYDETGQPLPQFDENGQPLTQYDPNAQLQYDENGQPVQQYDENGQPIVQYDQNGQPLPQYDENGQPLQQYYDENGQPVQYYGGADTVPQYDENGQPIQQEYVDQPYEDQQQYYDQQQDLGQQQQAEEQPIAEPKPNVLDILDTDTESAKQDTKISNDSDFDFSNT